MTGEEMRAALADELAGWPIGSGYYQYTVTGSDAHEMADALLPTVRRIAAEELRAAASDLATVPGNPYPLVVSEFLNARADRLDAAPDHGKA